MKQTKTTAKPTKKRSFKELLRDRRFRYGSLSLALCAAVIVSIIAFNVVITALASHFHWYADMTADEIYSITDASVDALNSVADTVDYKILFCADPDVIEGSELGMYVHQCAKAYESKTKNVTVDYLDLADPAQFLDYRTDETTKLATDSVIIAAFAKGSEKPTAFRTLSILSFYVSDSGNTTTTDIFAFDGEYRFTSSMLGLSGEKTTVYFTEGHGEDCSEASALYNLFLDAGYEVVIVDLRQTPVTDLKQGSVLVINDPKKDFYAYRETDEEGAKAADEIEKIRTFVRTYNGSLLLFMDPAAHNLPNLKELSDTFGIAFSDSKSYITDSSHSLDGATSLVASYPINTESQAQKMIGSLSSLKTIVPKATALTCSAPGVTADPASNDITWTAAGNSYTMFPLLLASETAEDGDPSRQAILMAMSAISYQQLDAEGNVVGDEKGNHYSYILACASPSFTNSAYLGNNSYANRDILYTLIFEISGKSQRLIPGNLESRLLTDESLQIEAGQANTWTAIIVTVLPLTFAVAGTVVYVRRKHL